MFALTNVSRRTRMILMLTAAVIVAASLSLGAVGAQHSQHPGYSVTITQLQ